jgi:hypothetical protein
VRVLPRRDEIEILVFGEDGANCLLIAVEWPIELSLFVVVGVNLAVALCPTDALAGVLLSRVPQVVLTRPGLMIEGVATLRGVGIRHRAVLLPLSEEMEEFRRTGKAREKCRSKCYASTARCPPSSDGAGSPAAR